jgi:hypothetical protein
LAFFHDPNIRAPADTWRPFRHLLGVEEQEQGLRLQPSSIISKSHEQ